MGRTQSCGKNGLKKGPWTPEEDKKLIEYIGNHGQGSWRTLAKNSGLARCGKSCRLRWMNYLRPDIRRGRFSFQEDETIIQLHSILGNKWSAIAARLPGRTDNEIKNYWNSHIRKRLLRMGIDPVTHRPYLHLHDRSSLVNQSPYNPAQFNESRLLGSKPLLNLELVKIANNVCSSQCQNHNLLQQSSQQSSLQNPQIQDQLQSFQAHQLQNPVHEISACALPNSQILDAVELMQTNSGQFSFSNTEPFSPGQISENLSFQQLNNINSCLSELAWTPESSLTGLNSLSTCIDIGIEDERDSQSSEMFKFQIPEIWDVSEFIVERETKKVEYVKVHA